MKKHLPKSLRALFLSLTVLLSLPMLAQKLNLKEVRLTDDVRELSLKESLGDISVPAPARHVVNNQAMKAPSRGENTNPYEAMAGEWIMTAVNTSTGATSEFNVIVHAVPEGDVGYNNTLYITGFHGYDWTVLTMTYNYNNETGSAEVAIIPDLFAEGVDFGLGGLNNVMVYNVVNNYLSTQPLIGEMSADSKTIDFGTNSLFGMIVNQDGSTTGYRWFWYTGIKMTKKSDLKRIKHNGVYYGLDTETNQATVMQNNDGEYAGDIVIPKSFAHDGITYSVTSIEWYAFAYCPELHDVYCFTNEVPYTEIYVFEGSYPENATLHVPAGSLESYRATEPWGSFGKIVDLAEEETGIGELKGENGTENSAVYDLSGRRVQKGQKGILIQNDKVVLK